MALSGPEWVDRYPTSSDPNDCVGEFRDNLIQFIKALHAAKATVKISATLRPPQRAYLMHHAYKIAHNVEDPGNVPKMAVINIDWVHRDEAGEPDLPKSRSAASQMVTAYGIVAQPALVSRHTQGRAVDMDISWNGTLTIAPRNGAPRPIASMPRTGENKELHAIGASYGVIKAVFAGDPPHWSDDGH
ncbi:hypothetical protein [Dongia sedimenti]|uniref:Peptidoglycan-binding domain-containing protein n=1 Tax=Dongia sedimenti TaxID=3064282 RepID=A0ABU0YY87_9PROT|nr:hypothetical protein [Rhodospirillaceae bacterium R-7]